MAAQVDDVGRARVASCGGSHAGRWLDCIPTALQLTAHARHYQLALAMRLGVALPEVVEASQAQRRCVCTATHDCYGRHPGLCRRGNRAALWTVRHDALQDALYGVARAVGRVVHVVGRVRWFSSGALAAVGRAMDRGLYADLVSAPTTTAVAVLPSIFSEEKAEFLTSDNVKMQILQLGAALDRGQVYNPTSGEQYKQNMDMARKKIELLISKRRPNSLRFQSMEGEWELVLSTVPHGIVSI